MAEPLTHPVKIIPFPNENKIVEVKDGLTAKTRIDLLMHVNEPVNLNLESDPPNSIPSHPIPIKNGKQKKKENRVFAGHEIPGQLGKKDVTCPICMSVYIEPVTFPCKHSLCKECYEMHVRETSLQCPMCRCRLSVWSRKATKMKTLVNENFWERIKQQYPVEVEARLLGEDSQSLLDRCTAETPTKRDGVISVPGEIRKEFDVILTQYNQEVKTEQERQLEATKQYLRILEEKEGPPIETQLESDFELAKRLQEEEKQQNRLDREELRQRKKGFQSASGSGSGHNQSQARLHTSSATLSVKRKSTNAKTSFSSRSASKPKRQCFSANQSNSGKQKTIQNYFENVPFVATCSKSGSDTPDSINDEFNQHFRPISCAPRTPPKRNADGSVGTAIVVKSLATRRSLMDEFNASEQDDIKESKQLIKPPNKYINNFLQKCRQKMLSPILPPQNNFMEYFQDDRSLPMISNSPNKFDLSFNICESSVKILTDTSAEKQVSMSACSSTALDHQDYLGLPPVNKNEKILTPTPAPASTEKQESVCVLHNECNNSDFNTELPVQNECLGPIQRSSILNDQGYSAVELVNQTEITRTTVSPEKELPPYILVSESNDRNFNKLDSSQNILFVIQNQSPSPIPKPTSSAILFNDQGYSGVELLNQNYKISITDSPEKELPGCISESDDNCVYSNSDPRQNYPGLTIQNQDRSPIKSNCESTNSSEIFNDQEYLSRREKKLRLAKIQEEKDRKLALRVQKEWNRINYVERDYATRTKLRTIKNLVGPNTNIEGSENKIGSREFTWRAKEKLVSTFSKSSVAPSTAGKFADIPNPKSEYPIKTVNGRTSQRQGRGRPPKRPRGGNPQKRGETGPPSKDISTSVGPETIVGNEIRIGQLKKPVQEATVLNPSLSVTSTSPGIRKSIRQSTLKPLSYKGQINTNVKSSELRTATSSTVAASPIRKNTNSEVPEVSSNAISLIRQLKSVAPSLPSIGSSFSGKPATRASSSSSWSSRISTSCSSSSGCSMEPNYGSPVKSKREKKTPVRFNM